MSLYYVQKVLYELNRDEKVQQRFREDLESLLAEYDLEADEREAFIDGNVGLLYVMGVNGQLLMHFSALIGQSWDQYIAAMKAGVERYGPVRGGLYTLLEDREP